MAIKQTVKTTQTTMQTPTTTQTTTAGTTTTQTTTEGATTTKTTTQQCIPCTPPALETVPSIIDTILADVNAIIPNFSSLVSSYRLLVGAAEEIHRIPGVCPDVFERAVRRFDNTGTLIDILLDLLCCKIAYSSEFLSIICAPIDLFRLFNNRLEPCDQSHLTADQIITLEALRRTVADCLECPCFSDNPVVCPPPPITTPPQAPPSSTPPPTTSRLKSSPVNTANNMEHQQLCEETATQSKLQNTDCASNNTQQSENIAIPKHKLIHKSNKKESNDHSPIYSSHLRRRYI